MVVRSRNRLRASCELSYPARATSLGTLRPASRKAARTLAQVEMAHATVVFAREGSAADMTDKAFTEWLRSRGQRYGHLRAMLGVVREHKPQSAGEAVS